MSEYTVHGGSSIRKSVNEHCGQKAELYHPCHSIPYHPYHTISYHTKQSVMEINFFRIPILVFQNQSLPVMVLFSVTVSSPPGMIASICEHSFWFSSSMNLVPPSMLTRPCSLSHRSHRKGINVPIIGPPSFLWDVLFHPELYFLRIPLFLPDVRCFCLLLSLCHLCFVFFSALCFRKGNCGFRTQSTYQFVS